MEATSALETGGLVKAADTPSIAESRQVEEEEALDRCARGDLAGYRWLYDRYGQPLLRSAFRILGGREEAEDAVQETFLKLYRHIGTVKAGPSFSSYLFRILINNCTDILRKRSAGRPMSAAEIEIPVHSGSETRQTIEEAIASLPERMRACFVLVAVEEFSYAEAARMLGLHVGSVKVTVHRARAKLRQWLAAAPAFEGEGT
jgi:RNA polymerase sigma-70 factor (ECF subfamily)